MIISVVNSFDSLRSLRTIAFDSLRSYFILFFISFTMSEVEGLRMLPLVSCLIYQSFRATKNRTAEIQQFGIMLLMCPFAGGARDAIPSTTAVAYSAGSATFNRKVC